MSAGHSRLILRSSIGKETPSLKVLQGSETGQDLARFAILALYDSLPRLLKSPVLYV